MGLRLFISIIVSLFCAIILFSQRIYLARLLGYMDLSLFFFLNESVTFALIGASSTKDVLINFKNSSNEINKKSEYIGLVLGWLCISCAVFAFLVNLSAYNINYSHLLFWQCLFYLFVQSIAISLNAILLYRGRLTALEFVMLYQVLFQFLCIILISRYQNEFTINTIFFVLILVSISSITIGIYLNIDDLVRLLNKSLQVKFSTSTIVKSLVSAFEFFSYEGFFYVGTVLAINMYFDKLRILATFQVVSKSIFVAVSGVFGYAIYRLISTKLDEGTILYIVRKFFNARYVILACWIYGCVIFLMFNFRPLIEYSVKLLFGSGYEIQTVGLIILISIIPLSSFTFLLSAILKVLAENVFILQSRIIAIFILCIFSMLANFYEVVAFVAVEIGMAAGTVYLVIVLCSRVVKLASQSR
jgi:hypothetical protein